MTLTSVKDVSENPVANGVTVPTNAAFKAKDIDRKMKLYGVFEAFRHGKFPSNSQIDKTLFYALNHSPIDQSRLSPDGKLLISDFQAIIDTARTMVAVKNKDELFQQFLYHTRDVDYSKGSLKNINTPLNKDDAGRDAQLAAEHLRTLGKLIFTNSEFRKILKDASFLGRDVLADGLSKAANGARPTEQQLADVDDPAPSNQWEGANGVTADHTTGVPRTEVEALVDHANRKKEEVREIVAQDMRQVQAKVDAQTTRTGPDGQIVVQDPEVAKADGKATLKEKTWGRISDKHKDVLKEQYEAGKHYAKDKFPEERKQRFIYRLKKVVVELQRHRDYQDAIEFFLNMAHSYGTQAKSVGAASGDQGLNVRNDPGFIQAETELRTLLERFANNTSFQPVIDAVSQVYKDAENDAELRAWFKQLDDYVRTVLQEPGYVMSDQADKEGRRIWDDGRKFFDVKYKGTRDNVLDQLSFFFKAYADDPINVKFGENWKKLTKDLLHDGDGNLKYKPQLWADVRNIILPQLIEDIGYVPIPRIEYTDHMLDLVIENLTLESQNLLPNVIEMEIKNYFKLSPYAAINDRSTHSFWISFSQVQADLKDVAFYVRKKSGFPKITDSGLVDVQLSGKGISGRIHVESVEARGAMFKVVDVKVKVDKLKLAIRESKHQFLYSTLKPLATRLIKKQIQKAIQDAIHSGLVHLDAQLIDLRDRLDTADGSDGAPTKMEAFKETFGEKKEQASSKAASIDEKTGTFKIVAKRDSKILDWASKDSMVEKQGDRLDRAVGGQGWKSPAFDIVT